jgi:DNA-binding NarL/FixJ family response regulator
MGVEIVGRHEELLAIEDFLDAVPAGGQALLLEGDAGIGKTALALGTLQRQARRKRVARDALEQAAEIFEQLGARLWLEQAQSELRRIGGRAPSSGELTPNEQRIAELVSEGKTNKEVAAILVVADRTVESALTQIYRKLDVRSRTELAHKLAAHS